MLFQTAALTVLLAAGQAEATFGLLKWGSGGGLWDCLRPPNRSQNECSRGFWCWGNNQQLCSSSRTCAEPPRTNQWSCPNGWWWHGKASCCVPRQNNQRCSCPPGYIFEGLGRQGRCVAKRNETPCSPDEFWWVDGKRCCPNNWAENQCKRCEEKKCPPNFYLSKENKCLPVTGGGGGPDCKDGYVWDWNTHCCKPTGPQPSGIPNNNNNHWGKKQGLSNRWRRDLAALTGLTELQLRDESIETVFDRTDYDRHHCPSGLKACQIPGEFGSDGVECVDTINDAEFCGGCAGQGQNCYDIPNALDVRCKVGACQVVKCKRGFQPNAAETACVAA